MFFFVLCCSSWSVALREKAEPPALPRGSALQKAPRGAGWYLRRGREGDRLRRIRQRRAQAEEHLKTATSDGVAFFQSDASVFAINDLDQKSIAFALCAGTKNDYLIIRQAQKLAVAIDQCLGIEFQIADLMGDLNVVVHGPALQIDLASVFLGQFKDLLDTAQL